MNKKLTRLQLAKLIGTRDDDLINEFPGYTRRYLRAAKREYIAAQPKKAPKVLLFDIENAPADTRTWGGGKQYISNDQIVNDIFILSWSAKWLFDDQVMHDCVTPREAKRRDDKRVVKRLWKLLSEADIVIAHNGDEFDIPKMNARFLLYSLPIPKLYKSIDTFKVARKNFYITSNKLDYIARFLGLHTKIDTGGFELWNRCVEGDAEALRLMDEYNQNDVRVLEEVYLALRPYDRQHPNMGLYVETDKPVCPVCGGTELQWGGFYMTSVNKHRTARCSCGAVVRERVSALTQKERANILR